MGNVSKTVGFLVSLGLLCSGTFSWGETREKPTLRLQGQRPQKTEGPGGRPSPEPGWSPREKTPPPQNGGDGVYRGFSLMASTPLFRETVYEARFSSWGLEGLFSLPLGPLGEGPHGFAIETGVRVTYSSLQLPLPAVAFSYFSFVIPVRARMVFAMGDWWWEVFAGGVIEAFSLDSRPAPDGGFHTAFNFVFDGGGGVSYPLFSDTGRIRLTASYTALSLGVYWHL